MYKRVVVPLDGSTTAMQVLPYATLIAKASGAKIELIQSLNAYPRELVRKVSHEQVGGKPVKVLHRTFTRSPTCITHD